MKSVGRWPNRKKGADSQKCLGSTGLHDPAGLPFLLPCGPLTLPTPLKFAVVFCSGFLLGRTCIHKCMHQEHMHVLYVYILEYTFFMLCFVSCLLHYYDN